MAKEGITVRAAVAGWEMATEYLGGPCRRLQKVHDTIMQAACDMAARGA